MRSTRLLGRIRSAVQRMYGARVGEYTTIGKGVECVNPSSMQIGARSTIEPYVVLQCSVRAAKFTDRALDIGDDVYVGRFTYIEANLSVKIGNDTLIAANCYITDSNHRFGDVMRPIRTQGGVYDEVVIGPNVWIGAHCVILAGVTIGQGSVIAANSTVTKDVPKMVIAGGSPCRVLQERLVDSAVQ